MPRASQILRSFVLLCAALSAPLARCARVEQLQCEHERNPIGIGNIHPRLTWKIISSREGETQTAFQIQAASSAELLSKSRPDLWDSGKVHTDQSILIEWAGKPLSSRSEVFWRVGKPTAWSDMATFELGVLPASDWKGQWITADLPRCPAVPPVLVEASWIWAEGATNSSVAFRRTLVLPENSIISSAVAQISAEKGFTFFVNGRQARRAPDNRPGAWKKPTRADFGSLLLGGTNLLAILAPAAEDSGVIAHIVVELGDGSRVELNSDSAWKAASEPVDGWQNGDFDDSSWAGAKVLGKYGAEPWGDFVTDNTTGPGRYLHKSFSVHGFITKARLYSTALGVYEASINGKRVSDHLLDPGWTDYHKRVPVQTADVTHLLNRGENSLDAVLADGWYAGRLGWMGLAQYGVRPVLNAQLEITYADGTTETIATDFSWKAGPGEIVGSDQQWGEVIDARRITSTFASAVTEQHDILLVPQIGPPVRKLLELVPQKISRRGNAWIADLGQNMVGHVRLTGHGPAGTVITLRHGEMLNPDGSLYTANLRPARATDTFILKGAREPETFEPHFTFHGFRYVEVTGYPGELSANDLRGIVVGSDTPQTGTWECSDQNLNRLYQNIVWGQRGNFLSVPTDCPQRDERMGWMGDAQVFAPTAALNADVSGFFAKWLVDVDDGQTTNGDYSDVSPRIARPQPAWPVWGDAGVIIPWVMYTTYGDKAFLADNYASMARWVDYSRRASDGLLRTGGVGDHLAPRRTPIGVVDTAYFANSASIVAKAAALLGKSEDAAKYEKLHQDIYDAFNKAYASPDGAITGDTQTAYILALRFGLLPQELRPLAAQRLAQNVERNGHLTTGFVGVGLICPELSAIGRSDLAWRLLFTDSYPSWLFSVKNGATTIWERWDGWTPERGFQDPAMNSFNHYSLGSVGAWLYAGAAGIQQDESQPGYKHFFLRPQMTDRLTYAKATFDSPYGVISSNWRRQNGQVFYDVTIPPNTSADLVLPVAPQSVRQSGKPLPPTTGSTTSLHLVTGTYRFSFPEPKRLQEPPLPSPL